MRTARPGHSPASVWSICVFSTQQPEWPFEELSHRTVWCSGPPAPPPAPTPLGIKAAVFKGPLALPCRPALPSCRIPSHVLCSHIRGLCLYTRIVSSFSSGRKAASPQTSDPSSSVQKVSHPRPSLAAPFTLNSCLFVFLAALCSMWGLSSLTRDQTHTPCFGSMESQPPDPREVPQLLF